MTNTLLVFRVPLDAQQPVDLIFGDPAVEVKDSNAVFSATLNVTLTAEAVSPITAHFDATVPPPTLSGYVVQPIIAELSATAPAPTLTGLVAPPVILTMAVTMPAPTLTAESYYDNAVFRGPSPRIDNDWQVAEQTMIIADTKMDQAAKMQPVKCSPWVPAVRKRVDANATHAQSARSPRQRCSNWTEGVKRRAQAEAEHKVALMGARPQRTTTFSDADRLPAQNRSDYWIQLYRHARPEIDQPWQTGVAKRLDQCHDWQLGKWHRLWQEDKYTETRKPPPGRYIIPITPPVPEEGCYDPPLGNQVALLFDEALTGSPHLVFICRGDQPGATTTVPIRRAYIVINDVHLRRVSNNLELPCFSLSLNIDADSWTWGFNASLPASALSNVEPAGLGDPVELDAEINGIHYRLLAEKITKDRAFGSAKINVSGRGKSAILADPYSPAINFTHALDRTAQQLMGDILTMNGAPIGWSVEWNVTDWIVPAGVFAHQGSYMAGVNAIAGAIGGYILPHPTDNVLRVMNRYPVKPWEWNTVTPDIELPAAAVVKEGIEWAEYPNYNAVWLSGTAGGVLSQVKRTGTAGDIIAPMVTEALLTRTEAHTQRGISILGHTGRIATVTLELPVLPETGIIEPGKFVRYVDGATQRIGIVRSTSVSVANPSVRQSIAIETHA